MNAVRAEVHRLPAGPRVCALVAGHRSRLGRVNTELMEAGLSAHGSRLAMPGPAEAEDGLVRDVTEVLTSFCARLYGRRPVRNRAGKALRCAAHGAGPASREVTKPGRERHRDAVHHPLELAGLPAPTRDGRVRAAVSALIAAAREHGARAVVIEDLDFAGARAEGREKTGNRPSRGSRGRGFRRLIAGIPTARFRERLIQMTANAGLSVIVVDPAYTSRWAAEHWLAPLRQHHPDLTGHHAAALVIGRRGQGHRARLRATGNRAAPEDAARPAQARTRKPPSAPTAPRKTAAPWGTRQPPRGKTGTPDRTTAENQAPEDRSRAPTEPVFTIARC